MTIRSLFAIMFLSLAAMPAGAQAQDTQADSSEFAPPPDTTRLRDFRVTRSTQQGVLSEADRRIGVARTLIRQDNHEAAAALLESVLESEPNNGAAQNLLLVCYRELNYTLKAEALLRQLLARDPASYYLRVTLAEMLAGQGKTDEAIAAYNDAAELLTDWNDPRIPNLIRSQLNSGVVDHALDYVNRARRETGDSTLFALECGQLLERQGKYRRAVREYFPLLADDTSRMAADAEKRLFEMLTFVGSSKETEDALLHVSADALNPRALRLLSTHFIQTEQFDRAYETTLQQDSVDNGQGEALLYFIRQCAERRQYAQVCRMAERVASRYDLRSPVFIDALFHYADALAGLGEPDSAVVVLQQVVAASQSDNDRGEALYRIGTIYSDELNDCDRALVYYDSVVAGYRRGMGYLNARLQIPRCQIRLGELETATRTYTNLRDSRLSPEMNEEIDYQLAMIRVYRKQFDSAQVALRKLMVDYPRGFYVNDALRLVVTLNEIGENEQAAYDYSDALYFAARRMPDSARLRYDRLASGQALADIALLKLAELDLADHDSTSAMQSLNRMIERFPDSYYFPFGLKAKADLMMVDSKTVEEAVAIYRRLLADFPNYPFISEVRQRLRQYEQRRVG